MYGELRHILTSEARTILNRCDHLLPYMTFIESVKVEEYRLIKEFNRIANNYFDVNTRHKSKPYIGKVNHQCNTMYGTRNGLITDRRLDWFDRVTSKYMRRFKVGVIG